MFSNQDKKSSIKIFPDRYLYLESSADLQTRFLEFMAAVLFLGEKQLCLNTTLKVVSRSTMNRGNKRKRPLQFKELDLNTHKETDEIGDVVQVPKQMKIFILFYIHWNISYSTDNLIEKKKQLKW